MRLHGILFSPQELAPAVHAVRYVGTVHKSILGSVPGVCWGKWLLFYAHSLPTR